MDTLSRVYWIVDYEGIYGTMEWYYKFNLIFFLPWISQLISWIWDIIIINIHYAYTRSIPKHWRPWVGKKLKKTNKISNVSAHHSKRCCSQMVGLFSASTWCNSQKNMLRMLGNGEGLSWFVNRCSFWIGSTALTAENINDSIMSMWWL